MVELNSRGTIRIAAREREAEAPRERTRDFYGSSGAVWLNSHMWLWSYSVRDVLEQFLTVQPRAAVACLRAIGPAPWEVIAGGRLRMFGERQLDAMAKWVQHAASQQVGVYAGLPLRDGQTRHISIRTPRTVRPSDLRPAPSLIVTAEQHWLVWTLNEAVPLVEARRLALGLAKQCGGVPAIGEAIPLPGSIRYAETGVGLRARHNVTLLPPIERAYRLVGGEIGAAAVAPAAALEDGFERADQFDAPALEFLWPGVLPRGQFVLLAGPPKAGKSTIAVDLAARLTTGAAWPNGAPGSSPSGVILVETEDPVGVTQARLRAAGADMARVMLAGSPLDLSQPAGVAAIERQRVKLKGASVLIISPVRLFFGDMEARGQVDLRNRLAPLLSWALAQNITVLGLAHRESGKDGRSAEDVAGPRVFAQRARTVLSVLIDPADKSAKSNPNAARRILTTAGSNLAADTLELGYRIVSAGESSRVDWRK